MYWSRCMQPGHNPANEPAGFIVAAAANHVNQRIGAFSPFHQQRALLVREHRGSPLTIPTAHQQPAKFLFCIDRYLEHGRSALHAHGQEPAAAGKNGVAVGCQPPSPQILAEYFAQHVAVWGWLLFS